MPFQPTLFKMLIDKIIRLVNYRGAMNRALFVDHVEPIYGMLREIVADCLSPKSSFV